MKLCKREIEHWCLLSTSISIHIKEDPIHGHHLALNLGITLTVYSDRKDGFYSAYTHLDTYCGSGHSVNQT